MSSSTLFESIEIKHEYAVTLTKWVIEKYNIEDEVMKQRVLDGFLECEDIELIEKWKYINEFMDIEYADVSRLYSKTQSLINSMDEAIEKSETIGKIQFNF